VLLSPKFYNYILVVFGTCYSESFFYTDFEKFNVDLFMRIGLDFGCFLPFSSGLFAQIIEIKTFV